MNILRKRAQKAKKRNNFTFMTIFHNVAIKMETSSVNKNDIFDIYVKLRVVFFYKFCAFSYTVFLNLFHTHT